MRCFIAVDYEGDTSRMEQLQQALGAAADAKLVEPHQFHFTLKFLGEVLENDLPRIEERITRVASHFEPFSIELKGIGAFPSPRSARVVWAGAPQLFDLQKAVQEALPPVDKDITPHLTLARIRSAGPGLASFVRAHEHDLIGTVAVQDVRLKQSMLSKAGPSYTTLKAWRLIHV